MKVDFSLFEELHVYGRGDEIQKWTKKSWWKFFKEEEFDVEVYQRLVIAFRLKDHENLPKELEHVLNKDENFEVLKNDIEVVKNFVRSKI